MNRKTYRICLIMVIIAAIFSGIFYYRQIHRGQSNPKDGIFVQQVLMRSECV